MPYKVVVPPVLGRNEIAAEILSTNGCDVVHLPEPARGQPFAWTPDIIDRYIRDADGLLGVFGGMKITRDVLEAGERLRVVTSPIIGTENIDVAAATDLGIVVAFGATPENYLGVAEAVVMLIAAMRKQFVEKMDGLREGRRVGYAGHMVRGATIGFIGFGNIGRATAKRLAHWDCRLIAYDPYVSPDVAREHGVELMDLDSLLAQSDVVSIMVTLSEETRYLVGKRELSLMKQDAYLINTARGGCVDEAALFDGLESGRLAGAAIDTWETEQPAVSSPLLGHPKVLATWHNVGHSEELYAGHPPAAAENTLRALRGEEPLYVRNPEVIPRWRQRLARLEDLQEVRP